MTYTEDQLKRALVDALPDMLEMGVHSAYWKRPPAMMFSNAVTDHEWPAIVGMVEDGMDEVTQYDYVSELAQPTLFAMITAKWQTRAAALVEIGVLKIQGEGQ